MKTLMISILCLIQILMTAQDTIYKRNGEIIAAKVFEINQKDVSYKRADLPDGPLFISNKNEIKKIKYLTGSVDSFSVAKVEIQKPVYQSYQVYQPNPRTSFIESNQILSSMRRGKYIYHGRNFSDRNVLFLAQQKNQVWNNKEIKSNIAASRRNKTLQYTIGYAGAVIGGIGLYGCLAAITSSTSSNDAAITGIVTLASAGVLVSSQIVSFTYKLKRLKNSDRVMELYNQHSKN